MVAELHLLLQLNQRQPKAFPIATNNQNQNQMYSQPVDKVQSVIEVNILLNCSEKRLAINNFADRFVQRVKNVHVRTEIEGQPKNAIKVIYNSNQLVG